MPAAASCILAWLGRCAGRCGAAGMGGPVKKGCIGVDIGWKCGMTVGSGENMVAAAVVAGTKFVAILSRGRCSPRLVAI